ncbi:MAG: POTRA domain-containing protein [Bryobacteraceae bacterium]
MAPCFAQSFPLESLAIHGNSRIASGKIAAVSGLKIGTPVTKANFDNARTRLLATGAFLSVGYEFKPAADKQGYDATIEVAEVPQFFPYRFEDLPVPDEKLRAALRQQEPIFDDEIPATDEVLKRYASVIQQIVDGKEKVTGKLNSDVPGKLTIVFGTNQPRPNIAEVHFIGNQVLPEAVLMKTLSGVAIGTPYTDTRVRLLLDSSIRPLYEARGRIRVSFPKIAAEPANNIDGVSITVTVEEGPSYDLGPVGFTGVARADVGELRRLGKFQTGDIANFDQVNAGLDRIYHEYRGRGYLKASGQVTRGIDDKAHTVALSIALDPGARYTMGNLDIKGLDIESEPEIRKIWGLKTGAAFDPEYPDVFLKGVRDQGLFDNLGKTRAEMHINESSRTVDVTLYFSGAANSSECAKKPPLLF